jgi:hypothetical protein
MEEHHYVETTFIVSRYSDNFLGSANMLQPDAAFAASRLSLSSAILSFTPFPRGRDTYGLVAFPIMNTLFNLVTKRE